MASVWTVSSLMNKCKESGVDICELARRGGLKSARVRRRKAMLRAKAKGVENAWWND